MAPINEDMIVDGMIIAGCVGVVLVTAVVAVCTYWAWM